MSNDPEEYEFEYEGSIDHNRAQAHNLWLEQYKRYCERKNTEWFPEERLYIDAFIIEADDEAELGTLKELDVAIAYKTIGQFKIPRLALDVFECMCLVTKYDLELPVLLNGNRGILPSDTYNLSELIISSYPKNIYTDCFKGNCSGRNVGMLDEIIDPIQQIHACCGGLGIILMNETRDIVYPFATDLDLTKLTQNMYIYFLDK